MGRVASFSKALLGVLLACVVIFVLVEGVSSTVLLGWDSLFKTGPGLESRKHVQFDPELGWVNQPGLVAPDLYGPGVGATINAQSLRAQHEFSPAVPPGRSRVLCSGDSFTFGVGNADAETWCQQLEAAHPQVEAANAGEAAYGIGQMYLKARRLSEQQLKWNVHVTGFIADDVRRLTTLDFGGRNKPRARLKDGVLTWEGQPVTQASPLYLWFRANRRVFAPLRFLELGGRVGQKFSKPGPRGAAWSPAETADTVIAVFEATRELSRAQDAVAVFAFLPSGPHFDPEDERWRRELLPRCAAKGLICLDVVAPIRALDDASEDGMYTARWAHFSADGNRRVAEALWTQLVAIPEVAVRLGEGAPAAPVPEVGEGEGGARPD
jgi:hypothetical protein